MTAGEQHQQRGQVPAAAGSPELAMARHAALWVLGLAVPVVAVAAWAAGGPGAIGAGVGVAQVLLLFGLSAVLLAWAAPLGPEALMTAAMGGLLLRFLVYGLVLVLLGPVEAVHKPSLAVATAVVLVVTLAAEVRHVSRTPGFFWVRPGEVRAGNEPSSPARGPLR